MAVSSSEKVKGMVSNFRELSVLNAVINFNLLDSLQIGVPIHLTSLIGQFSQVNADAVERLIRFLDAYNYVDFDPVEKTLVVLEEGRFLVKDAGEVETRNLIRMYMSEWATRSFSSLDSTLSSKNSAFANCYNEEIFNYLSRNEQEGEKFNLAMKTGYSHRSEMYAKAYDFSQHRQVVDIGGGLGHVVHGIFKLVGGFQVVVFDLIKVIDEAKKAYLESSALDTPQFVSGDFFDGKTIPQSECYFLGHILHDWADEKCVAILKNLACNLESNGRVIVGERISDSEEFAKEVVQIDITMLTLSDDGRERSSAEFIDLGKMAGLKCTQILPTGIADHLLVFEADSEL